MKILILAAGKIKKSPELDLYNEYSKRFTGTLQLKELKNNACTADYSKYITPSDYVIGMDEKGENLTSTSMAKLIKLEQSNWRRFVFCIGGADGFDAQMHSHFKKIIAFGNITWPHMLLRALLMEQLYRSQQILSGHPYHRE